MAFEFNNTDATADPTADFLAREKQAAGAILGDDNELFGFSAPQGAQEHDFESRAADFPALDGEDDVAPYAAGPTGARADDFLEQDVSGPAAQDTYTLDDPVDQFQSNYPELDDDASAPVAAAAAPAPAHASEADPAHVSAYDDYFDRAESAPAPAAAPAPAPEAPKLTSYQNIDEETEPLRAWRERQADEIARRDAQAERVRGETISQAEQDIDKFYAEYNAQKEKNIKRNKENEARFQDERTRELAEGTTWTRVTKLLDLQNSQSKTIAKLGAGSTDLTRMKELYLSLRREGDTAPGAGGY
ncbi:Clathrin light chain [Malassezia cuniculi]|uniref:Clathrin light chain n=1 Tax=Malassezia cuniculi TaxID=948313 RepID=A0AAF0J828_9BASI|nr:Clathrin light chain [Malassezia cuniculi]